jgi:PPOX class probable F420-dependent enzyme
MSDFSSLAAERYISLESFRRDGRGVRTPVWFAATPDGAVIYLYTLEDSFKTKRIRRNPKIRIAACDMRGRVHGPWHDATATLVGGDECAAGMRLLDRKYFPWKQLIGLLALFRPRQRVVIALHPAGPPA